MSYWNYRIVKYRNDDGFGLHEVHYNADGRAWAMTEDPVGFVCDADEGMAAIVGMMVLALKDAKNRPVFEEPNEWPEAD